MNDNEGNIITFAKTGAPKPSVDSEDVTFTITSYANGSLGWIQNGKASEMEIIGLLEIVKAAIISGEYSDDGNGQT